MKNNFHIHIALKVMCKFHLPMYMSSFALLFVGVYVQTKIYDLKQFAHVDASAYADAQCRVNRTVCALSVFALFWSISSYLEEPAQEPKGSWK